MKEYLLQNWPAILLAIILVSFLLSRIFKIRTEPGNKQQSAAPVGVSDKRIKRLEAEIRRLKNNKPLWLKLLPWALIGGFLFVTYWPISGGSLTISGESVVLDERHRTWVREKGLNPALFGAVVARSQTQRNVETGRRIDSGGGTIDPWTVYSIYYGETSRNAVGCDPQEDSVCGRFIANDALAVRFSRFWEKAELQRQRKALEKILSQKVIQDRYPGISISTARGSPAGAVGVCQGMPWQITELMSDWIELGIFDPWGDPESIAEFTVRYLIRAYAKGGREAAFQSYNPGGPASYFDTLRKNASDLQASYKARFGQNEPVIDSSNTSTTSLVVGQKADTVLLRAIRFLEQTEAKLQKLVEVSQKAEKITEWINKVNTTIGIDLIDDGGIDQLVKGLNQMHSVAKWMLGFTRKWAEIAYGDNAEYVYATSVAGEARRNAPLAHDVQSVLSLEARPGGANGDYANNIKWALTLRWMKDQNKSGTYFGPNDPKLTKVDISGSFTIKPGQEWNYVQHFGCFCTAEGYLTWRGIPGAGACDLATAFNHLALLTPGLSPWHGEAHASQITGFTFEESVNIWTGRESGNLKIKNTTESPITIFWRLQPITVRIWAGQ